MIDLHNIGIFVAFFAGLVSFLSPCVFPLVPSYLAFLAGTTPPYELYRKQMTLASLCFTLGFGLVFSLAGVLLNSLLSFVAYDVQLWLSRAGGVLIVLFGMYVMGVFSLPFFDRQRVIQVKPFKSRYFTSFLFGAAFAAGWTPCVGAVLGAILGLAASEPAGAFGLLFTYAIGFSLPFILAGIFADSVAKIVQRFGGLSRPVMILFGIILVVIGVFVFTQTLGAVSNIDAIIRYFTEI